MTHIAPPARPRHAAIRSPRFRIALAWLAYIAIGIPAGALGVAWPSMRDTWNLPNASLGLLLLALTGGYLTGAFLSGRVITRLGMGRALLISSAVITAGLLAFGLAPGWSPLIAVAILLGLGQGTLDAGLNLYFANHFNARMMNWLHASFSVGTALGPFIVQWAITSGQGWRIVWLLIALGQLLLTFACAFTRRDWRIAPRPDAAAAPAPSIRATLRYPAVLLAMALFFIFVGIETAAGSWSFTLFSEIRAIAPATAATWVGLYWASFALGRILFGFVADRLPPVPSIYALLLAVLLGALLFSLPEPPALSLAGLLLIGFAQAPVFPLLITATPRRLGHAHATNAIGFQISAAGLGIAGLPALVGILAASASLEVLGPFLALSALLSLLLFSLVVRASTLAPPTSA